MDTAPANEQLLCVAEGLVLMGQQPQRAVNTLTRREFVVSDRVAEVLSAFALPRSAENGTALLSRRLHVDVEGIRSLVAGLHQKGLLREHDPRRARGATSVAQGGIFGAPLLAPETALSPENADVVCFGMPYDIGVSNKPGTRFGPEAIRRAGRAVFQYQLLSGTPIGAYCPVNDRRILHGLRIADVGDVRAAVMQQNGREFQQCEDFVHAATSSGQLPVMLGGDHSCSLPAILGAAREQTIGVLHFDAHDDYGGPPQGPWREQLHHGNFMSWVADCPNVQRIYQFGVRQRELRVAPRHAKTQMFPGRSALTLSDQQLLEAVDDSIPYYVTIDVDCLDPSVLESTGTPLPGGFRYEELLRLIHLLCAQRRVVALDLMELMPSGRDADALLCADLLVHCLDAATRGRHV